MKYTLTLRQDHLSQLRDHLIQPDGKERAAVVICGLSETQVGQVHHHERRLLGKQVFLVPDQAVDSSTPTHITWRTQFLVGVLKKAEAKQGQILVVHSHPSGALAFSKTDDANEPGLAKLAFNRNESMVVCGSMIVTPEGGLIGRAWDSSLVSQPFDRIRVLGDRFDLHFSDAMASSTHEEFHRQALALGPAFNTIMARLKIGVVGCGGTGSPTAMMLSRLGTGSVVLVDDDLVEKTNIHRLHGMSMQDVGKPKVQALKAAIEAIGLGTKVTAIKSWANTAEAFDALKSCDIIFGCTDDNSGRLFLNRLAYFYLIPLIDMGLSIDPGSQGLEKLHGRVTVVFPGNRCLLCREVIDPKKAADEDLKRTNPEEFSSRLEEAYVRGAGNPDPAVITFTTETSTMALSELIHRIQGFRGPEGSRPNRIRNFYACEDHKPGAALRNCELCTQDLYSGRGDCGPPMDGSYVSK